MLIVNGCETWTTAREEMRRIEAFEMWYYKRMKKISWTYRSINKEVLKRLSERKSMWKST